jgi:hypothetical protein
MKRIIFMGIVLSAATGVFTGCGDDDGGDDGGNGGSSSVNPECDPAGDGVCETDQDCPKVRTGDARETAGLCGQRCVSEPEPETCTVMCIVTEGEMSLECSICYAGVVGCASENCFDECIAEPSSDPCTQCQIDAGCRTQFDQCSGLMTPM